MIAAMNANYPIVSVLIKHGCNVGVESYDGKTAREYAHEAFMID